MKIFSYNLRHINKKDADADRAAKAAKPLAEAVKELSKNDRVRRRSSKRRPGRATRTDGHTRRCTRTQPAHASRALMRASLARTDPTQAKEYAMNVPRPKIIPKQHARESDAAGAGAAGYGAADGADEPPADTLLALEQRHLIQRERARQIKAQLGL